MLGEAGHQAVDGRRRDHQEQETTDDLEQPVQAFEDDADLEVWSRRSRGRNQGMLFLEVELGYRSRGVSLPGATVVRRRSHRLGLLRPAGAPSQEDGQGSGRGLLGVDLEVDTERGAEVTGELFTAGRSQAEVAHQLGVSRQNVSRWHARWRSGGSEALRSRLMTWIGVSIETRPAPEVRSQSRARSRARLTATGSSGRARARAEPPAPPLRRSPLHRMRRS